MQIRIVQPDLQIFDRHHQHVHVVRTDVVLDEQARAVARGRRIQPRVRELERCRAPESAHERPHQGPILGREPPDVRPVELLGGDLGGQRIERLVQVHHQQVQAIAALALAMRQGSELLGFQPLLRIERMQEFEPGIAPRQQLGRPRRCRLAHGARHRLQIGRHRLAPPVEMAQHQHPVGKIGAAHQLLQPPRLRHPRPGELGRPVRHRRLRITGMARRLLQQAQIELEPVIGRQRRLHPAGQQQGTLSQRRHRLFLAHLSLRRDHDAPSLTRKDCAAMTNPPERPNPLFVIGMKRTLTIVKFLAPCRRGSP